MKTRKKKVFVMNCIKKWWWRCNHNMQHSKTVERKMKKMKKKKASSIWIKLTEKLLIARHFSETGGTSFYRMEPWH